MLTETICGGASGDRRGITGCAGVGVGEGGTGVALVVGAGAGVAFTAVGSGTVFA